MSYKRHEIGETDIEYGGVITDIDTLPIGTKFYVTNGCWAGHIVARESGEKVLMVYDVGVYFRDNKAKVKNIVSIKPGSDDNIFALSDIIYPSNSECDKKLGNAGNIEGKEVASYDEECGLGDSGDMLDIDTRHTMIDEHPCSFCDMTVEFGAKCPYDGLCDTEKMKKCRTFFYFKLLQRYESERFGD